MLYLSHHLIPFHAKANCFILTMYFIKALIVSYVYAGYIQGIIAEKTVQTFSNERAAKPRVSEISAHVNWRGPCVSRGADRRAIFIGADPLHLTSLQILYGHFISVTSTLLAFHLGLVVNNVRACIHQSLQPCKASLRLGIPLNTLQVLYLSLWVHDDVRACVHQSLQPCQCFIWGLVVKHILFVHCLFNLRVRVHSSVTVPHRRLELIHSRLFF